MSAGSGRRRRRVWFVGGVLAGIGVGVLIWLWLPSAPERKAQGLLRSLVEGDLQEAWSYASAEERSRTNLEAFERVYRAIVSQMGGWELDGPVRVEWFGGGYVNAETTVKCKNGVRFDPFVPIRVRNGKERIGVVYAFFYGMLVWYVVERDGLSYSREAIRKAQEEYAPLFVREGITQFFDPDLERWYGWDGSEVFYDQVRGRWYKWDGSEVQK
jgi:hypothetical protein